MATARWKYTERPARQQVTVNGILATELLCWDFMGGKPERCVCEGTRAHALELCCFGAVNDALGVAKKLTCRKRGCTKRHPAVAEVLTALEQWHVATTGELPVIGVAKAPMLREIAGASAATATSTAAAAAAEPLAELSAKPHQQSAFQLRGQRCSVPAEVVRSRLSRKGEANPYVARFVREPFFEAMLADDRLRQLLCARKAAKEISEAYGIASRVTAAMRAVADARRGRGATRGGLEPNGRVSATCTAEAETEEELSCTTGKGFVVLDVCSGKGFASVLVSLLQPLAQVVMLDVDGGMDLSHVAARPNLAFQPLDLFSGDAPAVLAGLASGKACVAMGVHLCGALSPRLATLCCRLPAVDALCFCPCCLKGALGSFVQREAAARLGRHVTQEGSSSANGSANGSAQGSAKGSAQGSAKGSAQGSAKGSAQGSAKGSTHGTAAAYEVLVEVLAGLCREELEKGQGKTQGLGQDDIGGLGAGGGAGGGAAGSAVLCGPCCRDAGAGSVSVEFDPHVMSPRNGFISLVKAAKC